MERLTAREILTRARSIMGERGKTEGTFINSRGECCLLGALIVAAGGERNHLYPPEINEEPYEAARQVLRKEVRPIGIIRWSDTHTKDEALRLLGKAAASI